MSTHLIIPDPHARPGVSNERASWLSKLIVDLKPNVIINMGDLADMMSLSSYDKGTRGAVGRTYKADVDAAKDFNERLFHDIKRLHRRRPRRVILIGNHEQRIDRALDANQALVGHVGYGDLDYEAHYDDVVYYRGNTPDVIVIDGVAYAHYFLTGVSGRPIGGEHPAYSLVTKNFTSCTQGHTHVLDMCDRVNVAGNRVKGLVAGCYFEDDLEWAGEANRMYWRGVAIKRNVENGVYDLELVSINTLKKMYGS